MDFFCISKDSGMNWFPDSAYKFKMQYQSNLELYFQFGSLEEFQEEFKDINQEEQISRLHKMLAPHLLRSISLKLTFFLFLSCFIF